MVKAALAKIMARIRARSQDSRTKYLARIEATRRAGPRREWLGCANLAHGFAACAGHEKHALRRHRGGHGGWRAQSDFEHGQPAGDQSTGLGDCVLDALDSEHGNDRRAAKHRQGRLAMRIEH
jgi:hypothetical protein